MTEDTKPLESAQWLEKGLPEGQAEMLHPGEIVARQLISLHVNHSQFARIIGVSVASVSRFLAGKTRLKAPLALRIAAVMGNTAEYWLNLQGIYELHQLKGKINITAFPLFDSKGNPLFHLQNCGK